MLDSVATTPARRLREVDDSQRRLACSEITAVCRRSLLQRYRCGLCTNHEKIDRECSKSAHLLIKDPRGLLETFLDLLIAANGASGTFSVRSACAGIEFLEYRSMAGIVFALRE